MTPSVCSCKVVKPGTFNDGSIKEWHSCSESKFLVGRCGSANRYGLFELLELAQVGISPDAKTPLPDR